MDRPALQRWMQAYERAWREPGTAGLGALFADDAVYLTSPTAEPVRGLDAVRALWEEARSPGERFTASWEIVAAEGSTGVVRVRVDYTAPEPQAFHDLWIVTLDAEGRCTRFEEWYVSAAGG